MREIAVPILSLSIVEPVDLDLLPDLQVRDFGLTKPQAGERAYPDGEVGANEAAGSKLVPMVFAQLR